MNRWKHPGVGKMNGEFGELFGSLTIFFFVMTMLNYVVKFMNRTLSKEIGKYPGFKKIWMKLTRVLIKYHKYFGFATVTSLLIHFALQSNFKWMSASGLVAGGILLLQLGLGMYGAFINKQRKGTWFVAHRMVSLALVVAILMHVS
jgi:hypothetical protein